jgi:methionyl-tRNA formyltransferase
MKLLFMGTAAFAVPALKAVKAAGHEVALVVSQPDRPKGRGHGMQAPALKLAAQELGLEVFQPEKIREASAVERVKAAQAEVLCVVAYGQILPKAVLDAPRIMPLNVHGSLLPKYRGAAPIEWALALGEKETGVCVQKMAEKLDAGEVLMSEALSLTESDDAESITPRLALMGAGLLVKALAALAAGKAELQVQDESKATYAPLLKKSHGSLDFSLSSHELMNRFRGFKARPGVYSALAGTLLRIHRMSASHELQAGPDRQGQILALTARGLEVGCLGGSVWLEEIQSPGGKAMPASDWARGHKVAAGNSLERPVI